MLDAVLASRRAPAAAVAVIAAAALSACGSSSDHKKPAKPAVATPTLNTNTVAEAIVQSIQEEKKLTATVKCPTDVPQKKGHDFNCVATTYRTVSGKRTPVYTQFTVTQVNDRGDVYYSSPGK